MNDDVQLSSSDFTMKCDETSRILFEVYEGYNASINPIPRVKLVDTNILLTILFVIFYSVCHMNDDVQLLSSDFTTKCDKTSRILFKVYEGYNASINPIPRVKLVDTNVLLTILFVIFYSVCHMNDDVQLLSSDSIMKCDKASGILLKVYEGCNASMNPIPRVKLVDANKMRL
jgi:nicotinamide riboside kinase